MDPSGYGNVEFDFENHVMTKMLAPLDNDQSEQMPYLKSDPRHRIVVCQHWLLGLCQVGSDCTYLHRFDKNKMPQCKHGSSCKIKNCPLKHGEVEQLECIFYKQGFCYHGPTCIRRHISRPPEECPIEASFESAVYASSGYGNTNPANKRTKANQPNENYKITLCSHWLQSGNCTFNDSCHFAHGEAEVHDGQQSQVDLLTEAEIYDPTRSKMDAPLRIPFTQQDKIAYFMLQSPDLRSLRISRRRGRWAVPHWMRDEMNEALANSKYVILFFMCRALRGIYGLARLTGEIPAPVVGSPMTREFPVQWIRTIRIPLRSIAQMKIASTGMYVGKTTNDVRVDIRLGLDLLFVAYRKPEWDWTLEFDRATYVPIIDNNDVALHRLVNNPALNSLHPDQLFSDDWVAKVMSGDKSGGRDRGNQFRNNTRPDNRGADASFQGNNDPSGFVFCSSRALVEEMLVK